MQLLWAALANMLKFLSISYTDTTEAVDRKKKKINQVRKKKQKKTPSLLEQNDTFIQPTLEAISNHLECKYIPMSVTGTPYSKAEIAVHLPVPFCPALSLILGSRGVPSESLYFRMFAVISIRNESSSVLFHCSKA